MTRAFTFLLAMVALSIGETKALAPYYYEINDLEEGDLAEPSEYPEDMLDNSLQNIAKRTPLIYVFRRACIRRGGNCDHRPGDCCHSSSCRCNLWGANCRCQRMGLFQKWG